MEKIKEIDKIHEQTLIKLSEKEKNVSKVVNRYLRMRLKRRIRYFTGIKI